MGFGQRLSRTTLGTAMCWILVLAVMLPLARSCGAQEIDAGQVEGPPRDELYRILARDVSLLEKQGRILKRAAKLAMPTVVHIKAGFTSRSGGRSTGQAEEAGSGVLVRLDGKDYVLTNRHVIKGWDTQHITIQLHDGREIHPDRTWDDWTTDVAVMAVSTDRLTPARLGDSDRVDIGDFVLAVGSPFGLSHSVTYGIVSAKGRHDLKLGGDRQGYDSQNEGDGVYFQDFIQTDAAINPGNSGGPLLNLRGEVIGINTAIASSSGGNEGIGFSIPINMVEIVARQLIEKGSLDRAYLGVKLDANFTPARATEMGLSSASGALVKDITPGSPAGQANLMARDVILKFGETRVQSDHHLVNLVGLAEVGKEVPLLVWRDRQSVQLVVKLGAWPQSPESN